MLKDNEVLVYKQTPNYYDLQKNSLEFISKYLDKVLDVIVPGNKVVIKPNFVKEHHLYKLDWDYIITHPTVIEMVLQSVIKRLENNGKIYVVDAPQTDSDYDMIMKNTGLPVIIERLKKETDVEIYYFDLREERYYYKEGIIVRKKKLPGDPNGTIKVNLRDQSEFYGKICKDYYGADYDMAETRRYHNETDNIYILSKTILDADVFINMPKLKTHKLAGVTISLKNLVGTCVIKNSIPHHTLGSPESGGDKFQNDTKKRRSESILKNLAIEVLKAKNPVINYPFILIKKIAGLFYGSPQSETIRNGIWYGNDTIWRSVLDLNKILLFADANGAMHDSVQRKYISIVDGILGGEKSGPMEADRKESGIIILGVNPVAVDTVGATLMGYDYKKIPSISHGYATKGYELTNFNSEDISIVSNEKIWEKKISEFTREETLKFEPHFGWKQNIELDK